MPLLWAYQMWWSPSSYMYMRDWGKLWKSWPSCKVPGGLFIKATWCSFPRLVAMPTHLGPTAILVAEADKLTLGQELTAWVPHSVLKYGQKILELLEAVWASKQVEVVPCWRHHKGETTAIWGNWKADQEAKQAALTGGQILTSLTTAIFPCPLSEWDPWYTSQE
jgi:hypothetical protein